VTADGALTLREALAVAELADRPVRIVFDPVVFAAGPNVVPITLTGSLQMPHELLFVDGAGASVALAEGGPGSVISISGDLVALRSIAVRGATGLTGVHLRQAHSVYLTGMILEGNRTGLLIQNSQGVVLSDSAELFGLENRRRNLVSQSFGAGISVIDSDLVIVTGTELRANAVDAIRLTGPSQGVSIGPPATFDQRAVSPVIIAGHPDVGVRLVDFDGPLLVRNAVFDGNHTDIHANSSQGIVVFLHNTVVHGSHAVAKFEQLAGPTDLYIANSIFEGQPGVQHLNCFGDDSLLTVAADTLMFSQEPLVEACPNLADALVGGENLWTDADPGFVNPAAGDYHLAPNSPAIDVGLEIELDEGQPLYLAPDAQKFCGQAPDLGAYEFCP
jgi:hypothetical protein